MSNVYTKFAFQVPCTPEEGRRLAEIADHIDDVECEVEGVEPLPPEVVALFDDPAYRRTGARIEEDGTVVAEEQGDPWVVAGLIQMCCPSVLPFTFIWIGDADKPLRDGYEAGAFRIFPDRIVGRTLTDLAEELT